MREFFRCWRRKIGCVTLVIACLLTGGWVRSRIVKDEISIRQDSGVTHHLISNRSRIAWKTITIDDLSSVHLKIGFFFSKAAEEDAFFGGSGADWRWHWQWCGFEFGAYTPDGPPWREDIWIIPYWPWAITMSVLSAYLLLWNHAAVS